MVGGAEIYALAFRNARKFTSREVQAAPEGDAFFPNLSPAEFREVKAERIRPGGAPTDEHPFTFIDLERRS